jgi:cytoskeleton protein RodZ
MMDTTPETSSTSKTADEPSVGELLRAAREAQGLTVADVAERIKFSVKQVEALEADKSESLPEGAFLRGFVRSYARTLHLDEAPLLALLSPPQTQHGDVSAVQGGGLDFVAGEASSKKNIYLMAAALLVAMVPAFFIWIEKDEAIVEKVVVQEVKLPEMDQAASAVVSAVSAVSAASAVVMPDAEPTQATPIVKAVPAPKVVEPVKEAVVAPKVTPPVALVVVVKPKLVESSPVAANPNATIEKPTLPLDQLKKRPIHIVFSQDSWMEIKDTNGELLLSRMNAAGTEKWIGGGRRAPYQVAIGKVSAVKLFYKGREVDLSKYSQSGVVRLVLE